MGERRTSKWKRLILFFASERHVLFNYIEKDKRQRNVKSMDFHLIFLSSDQHRQSSQQLFRIDFIILKSFIQCFKPSLKSCCLIRLLRHRSSSVKLNNHVFQSSMLTLNQLKKSPYIWMFFCYACREATIVC